MSLNITKPSLPSTRSNLSVSSAVDISGAGGGSLRTKTPSVFQDMSSLEVPNTLKGAFSWCKYLANWSPIHRAYVEAMTELPTTEILLKNRVESSQPIKAVQENRKTVEVEDDYISRLVHQEWDFRNLAKEVFRSLATYNNAVTLISYPFDKKLICEECGRKALAKSSKWKLRGKDFLLQCPSCGHEGEAIEVDEDVDIPEKVRFTTLDMELIDTKHHPLTGRTYVYYTIPSTLVNAIEEGDRDIICETPKAIIEAVLSHQDDDAATGNSGQPRVKLQEGLYYLSKKPGLPSAETQGLSFPTFAATFKDYWLLLTMRKAQEVIANGWIVPRRFLYPETSAAAGSLFDMLNISEYMGVIRQEITKHDKDPNYQSVIPFPIGELNLGGDAKALMLSQELRILIESICATLQCPLEFLFGGMSFSASSVTAKKMQTQLEGDRTHVLGLLQWALDHISDRMNLPRTVLEFSSFRLADDLQYTQMLFSLNQSQIISTRRLHEELGLDSTTELEAIKADVHFQSSVQQTMARTQAEIEQMMAAAPAVAQAEGEVTGMQAHISEMVNLRTWLRDNPDKMEFVLSQPELAMQIFGQAGQPAEDTPRYSEPETPDPEQVAPGYDQHTMNVNAGELSPEILHELMTSLEDASLAEQQEILLDVKNQWGLSAYKQVAAKLAQMNTLLGASPEDRPAQGRFA